MTSETRTTGAAGWALYAGVCLIFGATLLAQVALTLDRHLGTLRVVIIVGGNCTAVGAVFVISDAVGRGIPTSTASVIGGVERIAARPERE
jgi:hypothetical protein